MNEVQHVANIFTAICLGGTAVMFGVWAWRDWREKHKVEDSCGCVWCDMDSAPEPHDGKMQHRAGWIEFETRWAQCTRPH